MEDNNSRKMCDEVDMSMDDIVENEGCSKFFTIMEVILLYYFVFNLIVELFNAVNHAGFNDIKKNSLDNDCHHQKGRECECMNT